MVAGRKWSLRQVLLYNTMLIKLAHQLHMGLDHFSAIWRFDSEDTRKELHFLIVSNTIHLITTTRLAVILRCIYCYIDKSSSLHIYPQCRNSWQKEDGPIACVVVIQNQSGIQNATGMTPICRLASCLLFAWFH